MRIIICIKYDLSMILGMKYDFELLHVTFIVHVA